MSGDLEFPAYAFLLELCWPILSLDHPVHACIYVCVNIPCWWWGNSIHQEDWWIMEFRLRTTNNAGRDLPCSLFSVSLDNTDRSFVHSFVRLRTTTGWCPSNGIVRCAIHKRLNAYISDTLNSNRTTFFIVSAESVFRFDWFQTEVDPSMHSIFIRALCSMHSPVVATISTTTSARG